MRKAPGLILRTCSTSSTSAAIFVPLVTGPRYSSGMQHQGAGSKLVSVSFHIIGTTEPCQRTHTNTDGANTLSKA
ncbi:hypothetical protein B9Z19DRAFT_1171927, partial [Tuber borchii]